LAREVPENSGTRVAQGLLMLRAKQLALVSILGFIACGSPPDEHANASSAALVTAVGVDYSWARPDPNGLHNEGYAFAARYLSHDTSGKTITQGEADALWQAGVDVVVVWEDSATNALGGYGQGVADAQAADALAAAAGMPAGRPIYFAVDFDAQAYQQGTIDAYFQGVASVIGLARTGAYGGYGLIARSFDDNVIAWGWQTYAWSYGNWDGRAQVRQVQNGITAAGDGDCCDRDEAQTGDYGQWHSNKPPGGYIDTADCTAGITGWAQDPDTPTAPVNAALTFDGPVFSPGSQGMTFVANMSRQDLCGALGSCEHAFSIPIPLNMLDGNAHGVWGYAGDTTGGPAGVLFNSGRTFQCPTATPPVDPPHGVKRHVTDPPSYAAWKFVQLTDVSKQPDAVVSSYAQAGDWSATPTIVQADDGTPEVWIIDGEVRRHVINPDSLVAWHFTGDDVKKTPAADVYKYSKGLDLPAKPFLMQGSDPAIWVLDYSPDSPPPNAPAGDAGSPPSRNGNTDNGASGPGGCSVGVANRTDHQALAYLALALALVLTRRGRSRANSASR
jgi:hypothetical protein